jgi:hypothetical protein
MALFVSTINGAVPGGGGGGVPTAGISTNQVALYDADTLLLSGDDLNFISIGKAKGQALTIQSEKIALLTPSLGTSPECDFTISSINGKAPVGVFQSTMGITGPFPITCSAGTTTPIVNEYPLVGGHTYTACFNCNYALNTGDTSNGISVDFDIPSSGTSIGSVYSPPAFINNANNSDGASAAFSLTWKQYADSAVGGVYVTPSGSGYDGFIRSIVDGSDPRLVITDWGVLS